MRRRLCATLGSLAIVILFGCGGVTETSGQRPAGTGGGGSAGAGGTGGGGLGGRAGSGGRMDASSEVAPPPPDAGNIVSCEKNGDCVWGEIDREILASTDCICLFGCPYIALNQATATRRRQQYDALCNPRYDGKGQPCPIDDCAQPPPIACIDHVCATASQRTGLTCATPSDCGSGYDCIADVPGGYCVPGTPGAPPKCDPPACPTGAACVPLFWRSIAGMCLQSCTAQIDCRAGYICGSTDVVATVDAASLPKVCWIACEPGVPQSCNDSPFISSLHGTCLADGTCKCNGAYGKNPATGRCY